MSIIKHAVICAAGMGTRLGLNIPKCLVEVNNKKIIEYQLDLLKDVENIRIVVGFMEENVIDFVKSIRKDIIFVRNSNYRNTSNSHSLALGATGLSEPYLFLDGDVIVNPQDFKKFMESASDKTVVGLTKPKTEEAVFAHINDEKIVSFSLNEKSNYEWAGIAIMNNLDIDVEKGYVFKQFEKHLPLEYSLLETFEIDTPNDLETVDTHFKNVGIV